MSFRSEVISPNGVDRRTDSIIRSLTESGPGNKFVKFSTTHFKRAGNNVSLEARKRRVFACLKTHASSRPNAKISAIAVDEFGEVRGASEIVSTGRSASAAAADKLLSKL